MLPTGTVTFCSRMWWHVPSGTRPVAMKAALTRHHDILYAAAQHYHGHVFKILGDEFQIAFEVPRTPWKLHSRPSARCATSHGV